MSQISHVSQVSPISPISQLPQASQLAMGVRRLFLRVAFVCVMAGTGGLAGAIAGLVLVLVCQTVLGMSAGMVELMPSSVAFGAIFAITLGLFLMTRKSVPLA